MGINKKIEFFEGLKNDYEKIIKSLRDDSAINLRSEASVVDYILGELKWQEMSDEHKQNKRKAMISLSRKWSSNDNTQLDFTYEEAIIDYYDCAENILSNLSKETRDDKINRLYSMIYIEQYFINEYSRSARLRHTDYNIYTSLLKSIAKNDSYKWLSIESLLEKFETMYSHYNNKP